MFLFLFLVVLLLPLLDDNDNDDDDDECECRNHDKLTASSRTKCSNRASNKETISAEAVVTALASSGCGSSGFTDSGDNLCRLGVVVLLALVVAVAVAVAVVVLPGT